jgi:hypothetical protein
MLRRSRFIGGSRWSELHRAAACGKKKGLAISQPVSDACEGAKVISASIARPGGSIAYRTGVASWRFVERAM